MPRAGAGRATLVVIACVVVLAGARQGAQPVRLLARLEPGNWVTVMDPGTGLARRVYQSTADGVYGVSIAPRQDYLAFLEVTKGGTSEPGSPGLPRNRLVVIDTDGRVVARVEKDVQRYAWCGQGCLACIVGTYYEGGVGFKPRGAFVLDVAAGDERAILGVPAPYELVWAPFDSSVYIKGLVGPKSPSVYRFHIPTGLATPTEYRDFNFSPSGKYYLHGRSEENDTARLYETRGNRRVPLPGGAVFGEPAGWVFNHGDYLLLGRQGPTTFDSTGRASIRQGHPGAVEYTIYDVRSRRMVRKLSGEIAPWVRPRGVLALMSGGRLNLISEP